MKHEITEEETKLAEQIREKAKELQELAIKLTELGWDIFMEIPGSRVNTQLGKGPADDVKVVFKQSRFWKL